MAIRLIDVYPNRTGAANSDYPHGSIVNESAPDAGDGTPLERQWGNDGQGFLQALLETAGITPSGVPDTAPDSQYIDGLLDVTRGLTEVDVAGSSDVTLATYDRRMAMIRLTGTLTADIDVIVPDTARHYVFINETSGSFTVTVKTSGGTGVAVPQGRNEWVYSDGTNVVHTLNMYARTDPPAASDGGTDAYTTTMPSTPGTGETRSVRFGSANTTGAATLSINGGTATSLVDVDGNAWAGMIEGRVHRILNDGTNYVVLDPGGYVHAVNSVDSISFHEASEQTVGSGSYATILDLASPAELLGGVIYGRIGPGLRITVDGTVVIDRTATANGQVGSTSADVFGVTHVPMTKATASLRVEMYNTSQDPGDFGWRVYTR